MAKKTENPGKTNMLSGEGRFAAKADLHTHTFHSGDSPNSAKDLVEAAKKTQLDIIGVTDHNTTDGAIEVRALAKKESPGLLVLIGQEVRTLSGEIIIFGIEKNLPKKRPLIETIKLAKKQNGFIIAPHPFDIVRNGIGKSLDDVKKDIDAIEVINSKSVWSRFNKKALEFADQFNIPKVAGSDAHFPEYVGKCYTLIQVAKPTFSEQDIYNSIRAGKTICSGRTIGLINMNMFRRAKYLVHSIRKL